MIEDDHGNPGGSRRFHGIDILCAAIHDNHQVASFPRPDQVAHDIGMESVSLIVSVRYVVPHPGSFHETELHHEGRGGDSIHIVIAVDDDVAVFVNRGPEIASLPGVAAKVGSVEPFIFFRGRRAAS